MKNDEGFLRGKVPLLPNAGPRRIHVFSRAVVPDPDERPCRWDEAMVRFQARLCTCRQCMQPFVVLLYAFQDTNQGNTR